MPSTFVLAVGLDSSFLAIEGPVLQSAGCHITSTESIQEAIVQLRGLVFDLLLLDQSIPVHSRERLTFQIRTSGSQIPMVCVTDEPDDHEIFADAATRNEPDDLLRVVGELLAKRARANAAAPEKCLGSLLHFPGAGTIGPRRLWPRSRSG